MKKPTLKDLIFAEAKTKGLEVHSITNNCVLNLTDGKSIVSNSKRGLLDIIQKHN